LPIFPYTTLFRSGGDRWIWQFPDLLKSCFTMDTKFKHVSYLWDENKAKALENDEIGLLLYRSNLLGADLRLTNYAGGNTSCKTREIDPLTGNEVDVLWVKGSGGDLGTLKRNGLAGLYL